MTTTEMWQLSCLCLDKGNTEPCDSKDYFCAARLCINDLDYHQESRLVYLCVAESVYFINFTVYVY